MYKLVQINNFLIKKFELRCEVLFKQLSFQHVYTCDAVDILKHRILYNLITIFLYNYLNL